MAAASLGAANAIVNWRSAGDEVDYAVNDSGAKVLVVGSELMPTVNKIRESLTNVEKVIEVTPDGADGDEYEAWLAGLRAGRPARRRLTRRRVPGHVLLGHHRPAQGRDADPRQHGRPHRQRPRRLGVRARRQVHGLDAAVPRRRLVVRPVPDQRRRPERHDPRPRRRLAGRRDPQRRQPDVPGPGGARAGAAGGPGRGQAVRRAQDLHLRRRADAAPAAARGDGGLARHRLHAGLRPHRGRRRGHPALADDHRTAVADGHPERLVSAGRPIPGVERTRRRPGDPRGPAGRRARRDLAAGPPQLFKGYLGKPEETAAGDHRGRLVPHRRHGQGRRRAATSSSRTGSRT